MDHSELNRLKELALMQAIESREASNNYGNALIETILEANKHALKIALEHIPTTALERMVKIISDY